MIRSAPSNSILRLALVLTTAVTVWFSTSATPQNRTYSERLTEALQPYSNDQGPGYAISVVYQGAPVFTSYSGMANLEHQVPIDDKTIFDIGSIAKAFTGYAVALLVEEGKIDLNRSVRSYLPTLRASYQPVQIRHLLAHTSGLWDWGDAFTVSGFNLSTQAVTIEDVIEMLNLNPATNFPAGEQISYTNTGYVLLAGVISQVTGSSYEDFMQERIFGPLSMTSTSFSSPDVLTSHLASSYRKQDKYAPVARVFSAPGSSSILTNITDFTKWLTNYHHVTVGKESTHLLTRKSGTLNDGTKTHYGFGISVSESSGRRYVGGVNGSWSGFLSSLMHYSDEQLTIAIMCNHQCNMRGMLRAVTSTMLGETVEADATEDVKNASAPDTIAEIDLDQFAGVYRLLPGWFLWLSEEDGRLAAKQWAYSYFDSPVSIVDSQTVRIGKQNAYFSIGAEDKKFTWTDSVGTIPVERLVESDVPPDDYDNYAGLYLNEGLGTLYRVTDEGDSLKISHNVHGSDTLTPINESYFLGTGQFVAEIKFIFESGKIVGLNSASARLRDVFFRKLQ